MNPLHSNSFRCLLALAIASVGVSAQSYKLTSPDAKIAVEVRAGSGVRYDIAIDGQTVVRDAACGLQIDGQSYTTAKVKATKTREEKRTLTPDVKRKSATIAENYRELRIDLEDATAVVFRAYNEGVAYRIETALTKPSVKIDAETAEFRFAGDYKVYYPKEDQLMSHNERFWLPMQLSQIADKTIATLPAVVDAGAAKLAIAESDVDDYPGLWLKGTSSNAIAAMFPAVALKEKLVRDRDLTVTERAAYIAETRGTRTYPWRIYAVARKDTELITNQLVWLLATPSKVADTSWIHPGKVAWDWWNANNVYGVPFKSGVNNATYKYFIDFASKYGLDYIILDEGWYKLGNVLEVVPEIDVPELVAYGKQKHVGVILWVTSASLDAQMQKALDQYEKWGVKGVKVDFVQRDDQAMVNWLHKVSAETAKRHMLVDFHGVLRSTLMTRTWPNLISNEGVRGLENSKWGPDANPDHNVTLPYTRMLLGPMDYTPGAMLNASKGSFAAIFNRPMSMGTRCHQLAMYAIYESPLQMLADSPSNYLREPEAMEFLSKVPSVWDETVPLAGKLGESIAVARRSGKDWYVGAMTNWTARDIEIDLSFLGAGTFTMDAYSDGLNAAMMGSDYKKETSKVTAKQKLTLKLAPGGGFAARIHQ